jgi:hypothetical protein
VSRKASGLSHTLLDLRTGYAHFVKARQPETGEGAEVSALVGLFRRLLLFELFDLTALLLDFPLL